MTDALALLLRLNLAMAGAVALAMLLRRPARRLFGARVAYQLWALVPLAAAAMLAPVRVITVTAQTSTPTPAIFASAGDIAAPIAFPTGPGLSAVFTSLWIAGAVAALAHLVWRQVQFGRAIRTGRAGPAVVGVLRPRVVTPRDFAGRYTPREQRVVLAHEETHIARQDSRINAAVALARCLNWFNPLVHVLAHYLRIDQELACDAQVVAAHPAARRAYAEAMLKTQLAARPLPIGCYWPAQAAHPLAERIGLLSRPAPGRLGQALGAVLVTAISLSAGCAAWTARPAEIVTAPQSHAPRALPVAERSRPALGSSAAPAHEPVLQYGSTAPQPATDAAREVVAALPETAPDRPPPGLSEVTDDPEKAGPGRRLLPPGFFGPPRKVFGLADWSSVEPGSAVRVVATMKDPDGVPLTTDLTAFGSQARYRLGYIRRDSSHYRLFTSVAQHGDRFQVTAGLNRSFSRLVTGSIELAAGETGAITLPNGLQVNVTPTVRPETPEEVAEARGRARVDVMLSPRQS